MICILCSCRVALPPRFFLFYLPRAWLFEASSLACSRRDTSFPSPLLVELETMKERPQTVIGIYKDGVWEGERRFITMTSGGEVKLWVFPLLQCEWIGTLPSFINTPSENRTISTRQQLFSTRQQLSSRAISGSNFHGAETAWRLDRRQYKDKLMQSICKLDKMWARTESRPHGSLHVAAHCCATVCGDLKPAPSVRTEKVFIFQSTGFYHSWSGVKRIWQGLGFCDNSHSGVYI